MTFAGLGTVPRPSYQSTISYNYDAGDRLTSIVDSNSGTITPGFDALDRLLSESTPQGNVTYTYDAASREISMTVAGQPTVMYSYDNAGRVTQIGQGNSNALFSYDANRRRSSLTLPNGVSTAYAYDDASQLLSLSYQGTNPLGNLTYTYDPAGRLTQLSGSFARTGLPAPLSSATYDAANRLTNWAGTTFVYDSNGNLTSDGRNIYTWDARNQLVSISGGVLASFQYDALGRRIGKTASGVTTGFLYDGSNVVQELSGSTPSANLLTGGIDGLLIRSGASIENFLSDGLGSSIATTDATGAVATRYTYDPYGNTSSTGATSTNAFQYTGRENDGTGLYYYRARYYNPSIARFVSQDPIGFAGGGSNLYGYGFNSPLMFRDPSGNFPGAAVAPALAPVVEVGLGEAFGAEVAAGSLAGPLGAGAALALGGGYYYYKTHQTPQQPKPPGSPTSGRYSSPSPSTGRG